MAAKQESLFVTQLSNPEFDDNKAEHGTYNSRYVYCVDKAVNTLRVCIHESLIRDRLQDLIDAGVNVTISRTRS